MKKGKMVVTIEDFYEFIRGLRDLKKDFFELLIKNDRPSEVQINLLKRYLGELQFIKKHKIKFVPISYVMSLRYEILELEKDIIFLERGEVGLFDYFGKIHNTFKKELKKMENYFKGKDINFFITDRDGTINNYCENYFSSIQSIYNAFFLYKFSKRIKRTIILTSGSLKDFEKVNILSKGNFVFAGSKAREFKVLRGKKYLATFSKKERNVLFLLEESIEKLLLEERYKKFRFIGSGFQKKYGEITIARQDIFSSISKIQSKDFLLKVKNIVKEIDVNNEFFSVCDTGRDIEIILKSNLKSFDKGMGLEFLSDKLKISLSNALVAGDTMSDLSLLRSSKILSKNIFCIFVTKDLKLKDRVRRLCRKPVFISSPDVLIAFLYKFSKGNENEI